MNTVTLQYTTSILIYIYHFPREGAICEDASSFLLCVHRKFNVSYDKYK